MQITKDSIKKAIIKSQHCQRNWDLSKEIPQEDLDLIIHSVTNCPSKQNHAFYHVIAITDRDTIKKVHDETKGFGLPNGNVTTNSQTLANLLLVFVVAATSLAHKIKNQDHENSDMNVMKRDANMAIGIAAGYANLTSSILGYSTGCCACFNEPALKNILQIDEPIALLMGIGYKNLNKNRRLHHFTNEEFPTLEKEKIEVDFVS